MSKVAYLLGAGASYGSRGALQHFPVPFMSTDKTETPKGIQRDCRFLANSQKLYLNY